MAKLILRTLLVAAGLALLPTNAKAQPPRYVPPAGNTLPNALNYFRRDTGVLDQYNQFVAPIRQLDARLNSMAAQEQANFQASQANQRAIQQMRQTIANPTGVGAGFMNFSHYYRMPAGGRVPVSR